MTLQCGTLNDRCSPDKRRVLLVDDDDELLAVTQLGLESRGFEVVAVSCVNDALQHISSEHFDVLLSDVHAPNPGDGFTVVSAMRNKQPKAVTLLLSGYPAIQQALKAIVLQPDEVLLVRKPITEWNDDVPFGRNLKTL
jgi:DNA-binding NtrC family response regulator